MEEEALPPILPFFQSSNPKGCKEISETRTLDDPITLCAKKFMNVKGFISVAVVLGVGVVLFVLYQSEASEKNSLLIFTLLPTSEKGSLEEGFFHKKTAGGYLNGSRLVSMTLDKTDGKVRELSRGFLIASDPYVSYDGRWLLFAAKRTENEPLQIYQMQIDGSRLKPVTRSTSDSAEPCYLPDGRIVFSSSPQPTVGNPSQAQDQSSLFTCNLDGSQMERITFFNSFDRALTVLHDGRILFMRKLLNSEEEMLMTINPDGTGVQRFVDFRSLKDFGSLEGEKPSTKLPSGKLAVSYHPSKSRTYGLYEFDPVNHQMGKRLYENPDFHAIQPVMTMRSIKPKILTSVVNKEKQTGRLLCLNAYLSQIPLVAASASKPGRVQLLEAQSGQLLGEAPIAVDGSFYVEAPADRLLKLRIVGVQGQVLATLESGIWVRPNETRGCIGCHEDPGLAPENTIPMAVQKPPVVLGGGGTKTGDR